MSHSNINIWKYYRPIWSLEGGFQGEQEVKVVPKDFRIFTCFALPRKTSPGKGKGPGGVFPAGCSPAAPNSPKLGNLPLRKSLLDLCKAQLKVALMLLNQKTRDEKAAGERKGQLRCARKKAKSLDIIH